MKALVLHSGGIDSSTCLAIAINKWGAENVTSVGMMYGQRHAKELFAAEAVCNHYECDYLTIELPQMPKSMLTNPTQEIPDVDYDDLPEGQSPTYVPFRNGQLLSVIAGLASAPSLEGVDHEVYFGAHSEDAARWAYPDCTPEFIGAMANAIFIGTYQKVRLITPLQWLNKAEVIALGEDMLVPWGLTWSCYKGGEKHCGTCPTCRSRRRGFQEADVRDSTIYE